MHESNIEKESQPMLEELQAGLDGELNPAVRLTITDPLAPVLVEAETQVSGLVQGHARFRAVLMPITPN